MAPIKILLTGMSLLSLVGALTLGVLGCMTGGVAAGLPAFLILLGVSVLFGWLSRKVNF